MADLNEIEQHHKNKNNKKSEQGISEETLKYLNAMADLHEYKNQSQHDISEDSDVEKEQDIKKSVTSESYSDQFESESKESTNNDKTSYHNK